VEAVEFQDDGTSERIGGIQEERWHPDHVSGLPVHLVDSSSWRRYRDDYDSSFPDH
jgi:hypothetical protein